MTTYSPREIVSELDRFIVGHPDAKRAVAIALRNRWRRRRVPDDLRDEERIIELYRRSGRFAATSSRSSATWSRRRSD